MCDYHWQREKKDAISRDREWKRMRDGGIDRKGMRGVRLDRDRDARSRDREMKGKQLQRQMCQ